MSTTEIHDAEIVPDNEPTTELVHVPRRGQVLRPLDVAEQKEAMQTYQRGLREILDKTDWQSAGDRDFVKKSGWRKIAAWFDLSIELLRDQVERDDDGNVTRACVWARAVAPSGRFADGDGYCDVTEPRFSPKDDKDGWRRDKARQKLENDLRGTATTRATNRAISNLVGMGDVSAEEVTDDAPTVNAVFGPYRPEVGKAAGAACVRFCGGDSQKGVALWKLIVKDIGVGYMPHCVALALIDAADTANVVPDVEAPDPE